MKFIKLAGSICILCIIAACGGGGGSAGTPGAASSTTDKTVVSGIATKGPFIKGSAVKVYAVTNGKKGALITETAISDDNGSYSADLGSYTGPVLLEVSGSYRDEATGVNVTLPAAAPMRAALSHTQGNVSLPVTPLTELAVQKTGEVFTANAITAANSLVSNIFKVDIIATLPVAPTTAALANVNQAAKDYTLALAAVSQMASESSGTNGSDKLQTALATLSQGISTNGMAPSSATTFQTALKDFVTNSNNQTGISDTSTTGLINVGQLTHSYILSLQGNIPTGSVKGVQFDLILPAGVTVNVNSDKTVSSSSLVISGNGPSNAIFGASYSSGIMTIGIATTQRFGTGEFATLTCNIPSGTATPSASAFTIKNLNLIDASGNPVAEGSITVNEK